jgi:hypothetical protein
MRGGVGLIEPDDGNTGDGPEWPADPESPRSPKAEANPLKGLLVSVRLRPGVQDGRPTIPPARDRGSAPHLGAARNGPGK